MSDLLDQAGFFKYAQEVTRQILDQREEILRAFIAKHGMEPDSIEQVVEYKPDGSVVWTLNRRAQPEVAQAGWQPIETAPKDGTWFLAYEGPNGDRDRHEFAVVRPEECACCPRPNFWVNTGGRLFPTHWMPLPDPPAARAEILAGLLKGSRN